MSTMTELGQQELERCQRQAEERRAADDAYWKDIHERIDKIQAKIGEVAEIADKIEKMLGQDRNFSGEGCTSSP